MGPPPEPKTFAFGISAFKKYRELIPVTAIVSVAVVGAAWYCFYAFYTKTDVRVLRKRGKEPPWEEVKPTDKRKLRIVKPELYCPNPELEALRKEIGSYKT